MANESSRSSVYLDVNPGASRSGSVVSPEDPFRILVVGDFTGRANRGLCEPLSNRRPLLIDRDNFDEVLRDSRPSLQLAPMHLEFGTLDDFHPDRLYESVPAFRKLSDMRNRPAQRTADATPSIPVRSGLLDEIVLRSTDDVPIQAEDAADFARFLKKITAPHLEEREDPSQLEWSARIEAACAELMRSVLHNEAFQNLEASWRGLAMLTGRLNTDEQLKIHMFDATLEELLTDQEGLHTLFVREEDPWGVVIGNFVFGQADTDVRQLRRLAQVAHDGRTPFIAEASPPSGANDADWQSFRRSPESVWMGLAVPRFLLRLPYGSNTSPIEKFHFEEMPNQQHTSYLWGNPAFCCAYLLGLAFLQDGWSMRPGVFREVENLPLHTYQQDGETVVKPCAEVLLTERESDFLMEGGFMPLASIKNSDSVLLVRFQSAADPVTALAGQWGKTQE